MVAEVQVVTKVTKATNTRVVVATMEAAVAVAKEATTTATDMKVRAVVEATTDEAVALRAGAITGEAPPTTVAMREKSNHLRPVSSCRRLWRVVDFS